MKNSHIPGIARAASTAVAAALFAGLALGSLTAFAAGTGDDPTPAPDSLTPAEAKVRRRLEQDRPGPAGGADVRAAYVDAPYRFLWTPTHEQTRAYWCGPATVQVIDDYFGACAAQSTIAAYLGTSSAGTMFTKVDDALRHFTGRIYYYYGNLTSSQVALRIEHSILAHAQPLALDLSIGGAAWPNYVYDHSGHIVPCEGFDWRHFLVRLNDVYQEANWRTDGGSTLGHRLYPSSVVIGGVVSHPQRAVVSAP